MVARIDQLHYTVTTSVTEPPMAIKSFRHKGLEDYFYDGTTRGINAGHTVNLPFLVTPIARVFQPFMFSQIFPRSEVAQRATWMGKLQQSLDHMDFAWRLGISRILSYAKSN